MSSETKERQAEARKLELVDGGSLAGRGWIPHKRIKYADGKEPWYADVDATDECSRRIVAAWNATRMLSVEQLESGAIEKLVEAGRDMDNGYAAVADRLGRVCMSGEDMQSFLARGSMSEMAMAVQALRSALSPFQQGGE